MGLEPPLQKKTFEEFSLTPDQRAKLDELARTKHPAWIEFWQAFLHCEENTFYGVEKRFYEGAVELLRKIRPKSEISILSTSPIANHLVHAVSERHCPRCGSPDVYRRPRKGIVDAVVSQVFGRKPYYCDACDIHFYAKRSKRMTSSIYND